MESLETLLGYNFTNPLLLAEALTHPSLAYETQRPRFDNQRLEFLGDAVLQLALTAHLYKLFPANAEGDLTKIRARLVSKGALSNFAKTINLGDYVLLGKGEENSGGRERDSTLADAFEALLGAMYIDGGFDSVKEVLIKIIEPSLKSVTDDPDKKNPKGRLQEILQAIVPESPVYEITAESGPGHQKEFKVSVVWRGKLLAHGAGASKKEAEADAAQKAIDAESWA